MREEDVTVIDVRPSDEFTAGHIPGALSVPVQRAQAATPRDSEESRGDRVLPRAILRRIRSRR